MMIRFLLLKGTSNIIVLFAALAAFALVAAGLVAACQLPEPWPGLAAALQLNETCKGEREMLRLRNATDFA